VRKNKDLLLRLEISSVIIGVQKFKKIILSTRLMLSTPITNW